MSRFLTPIILLVIWFFAYTFFMGCKEPHCSEQENGYAAGHVDHEKSNGNDSLLSASELHATRDTDNVAYHKQAQVESDVKDVKSDNHSQQLSVTDNKAYINEHIELEQMKSEASNEHIDAKKKLLGSVSSGQTELSVKELSVKEASKPVMPVLALSGFDQYTQGQTQQGFGFATNSSKQQGEIPESTFLKRLVNDVQADESAVVQIIGQYAREEKNDSELPNLGLARASEVARILEQHGLSSHKVIKSFRQVEPTDTGFYGIELELTRLQKNIVDNETNIGDLEVLKESVHVYFSFNSDDILLNDDQRFRINQMIQYLNQAPNYQLVAVGHTDSQGDDHQNWLLGASRAQRVKNYVIAFGVDSNRIDTTSRGESQPVAPNETIKGRQLNRRVELLLQEVNIASNESKS